MKRLTYHEPDGTFGVEGIDMGKLDARLYLCICKLKDYEDTGVSPSDMQRFLDEFAWIYKRREQE